MSMPFVWSTIQDRSPETFNHFLLSQNLKSTDLQHGFGLQGRRTYATGSLKVYLEPFRVVVQHNSIKATNTSLFYSLYKLLKEIFLSFMDVNHVTWAILTIGRQDVLPCPTEIIDVPTGKVLGR